MVLSELDVKILHTVELKPTMSVKEIAERVGTSWITANRHITRLRELGILSDPIAVFNPIKLGFIRHIVLFSVTSEKQIEALELACDIYPYTHYRTRVYGPFTGLFTQFDIPPSGKSNLTSFLSGLKELGYYHHVQDMPSTGHRDSTPINLEMFDSKTTSWSYDWSKWSKAIKNASPVMPSVEPTVETPKLSSVDLVILRELTTHANVSQSILQEKYSLSQSTASRKMIAIKEQYIDSIRAQIDRSRFDVTSTKLFYCTETEHENLARIFNSFHNKAAPPFPLSIDILENGTLSIWGRLPPSHEHNLHYTIWAFFPRLQIFTMDTIKKHSTLYWFYPENYNLKTHDWRTDKDWMIDTPLQSLKGKFHFG